MLFTQFSEKPQYKILIIYISQLVIPGLLYYGVPNIYSAASASSTELELSYQWVLIVLMISWGGGSLLAGIIISRFGAYIGIMLGYFLAIIAFVLLLIKIDSVFFLIASSLIGLSLAFLMLDGTIAYFQQTSSNIIKFRKHVIQLTLFSGFAGTFTYLIISPVFMNLPFRLSLVLSLFVIVCFMLVSMVTFSKQYTSVETCCSQESKSKNILSLQGTMVTVLMLSQGIIQTVVFFELIMYFLSNYESRNIILISYAMIGVSQVFGRIIIHKLDNLGGLGINLISAILMLFGAVFCILSIYYNIYLLPVFAVAFGMGLGISTISKPLIVSKIFEHNFAFYNGFYSLVLNLSRAVIPLLLLFMSMSITHLLLILIIFNVCNILFTGLLLRINRT